MSSKNLLQPQLIVKCAVVGPSGVGKSCLVQRFLNDKFEKAHVATIGVEAKSHMFTGNNVGDHAAAGDAVKLQIWDTAGNRGSKSLALYVPYFKLQRLVVSLL